MRPRSCDIPHNAVRGSRKVRQQRAQTRSRILPALTQSRRVVAVEQQGHGHTADVDRPLRFEQMADDTAALLRHIGIEKADVYGYSTGGWVALHLAVRHPPMVRRLAVSSAAYDIDGYLPQIKKGLLNPRPEAFPEIIRESYERVAPKPEQWSTLVAKAGEQATAERGLTATQLSSISAPALVIAARRDPSGTRARTCSTAAYGARDPSEQRSRVLCQRQHCSVALESPCVLQSASMT
jgi:pimeloyl-ACP methyl ester carboxylesterase